MADAVTKIPKYCDLCHDEHGLPEELCLHARCHINAPLRAVLRGNMLTLYCYLPECNRAVATFRIVEAKAASV